MEHNILLVDDDPALIRVMAGMLSGLGQIRFATTGDAAMQVARTWQPDLMLLDAEMPSMDGFQVCEQMKADPALRDVPIIFVTSHSDYDFEVKGLELGAVDFMAKPVNGPLLQARVKTHLRIKRLTDELRNATMKDELTQLPNRSSLNDTLAMECRRGISTGARISMLLIELDHMLPFAQVHGHKASEQSLVSVANALLPLCKGPADTLTRFDQHSFALLLPGTERVDAQKRAQEAMAAVEALSIEHAASPISHHVTASVGIASYDDGCIFWGALRCVEEVNLDDKSLCTPQDLIRCAQGALSAARKRGHAQAWWAEVVPVTEVVHAREVLVLADDSVPA